ncbi:MAG: type II toxin-antitoxin system VapC family toxin, partial [Candidatus Methanofastidiosia archaeon]
MKVLDSDFLVAVLRGFHEVRDKMKYLDLEKNATTTINAFELLYGAKRSENMEKNVKLTKKLLNNLEIFGFCEKSADTASSIQSELMRNGKSIPLKDLFIAS